MTYPMTVKGCPFRTNFWPETPTKPVLAGGAGPAVVVGPADEEREVGGGGGGGGAAEVVGLTLVVVPTKHWK